MPVFIYHADIDDNFIVTDKSIPGLSKHYMTELSSDLIIPNPYSPLNRISVSEQGGNYLLDKSNLSDALNSVAAKIRFDIDALEAGLSQRKKELDRAEAALKMFQGEIPEPKK